MDKLIKINMDMGLLEYEMYQDIPEVEIGSENPLYGKNYDDFQQYLNQCIEEETNENINFYNTTTNRYIYYYNNYPIGEVGIRTTLNDFWINRGSQIFYKIRLSERGKGYGQRMMKLVLEECKRLGFKKIRINCNDLNYPSKKLIINNGGVIDENKKNYKTNEGTSSSYIINLK